MDDVRSCDQSCGLRRREFLGAAALTALALLEAACGDGDIGGTSPGNVLSGSTLVVPLANFPALAAVGGVARVDGGNGKPVALVRTGTATFNAFSLVCTHEGSTVGLTQTGFLCPNHGARFAFTGVWQGGQVTRDLFTLVNTYDPVAGTVTVNR
jgi:Rieske Fe-S protein